MLRSTISFMFRVVEVPRDTANVLVAETRATSPMAQPIISLLPLPSFIRRSTHSMEDMVVPTSKLMRKFSGTF
jgi:hypothetical protein